MERSQKVRLRQQKIIAEARIHIERANDELKDFKTLLHHFLRCYANILLQLCAAFVNFQFALIKEVCEDMLLSTVDFSV